MERVPGETSNDYSDRLIRQAALWYSQHLDGSGLRALLLTDDRDNLRTAKKEGVPCMRGTDSRPAPPPTAGADRHRRAAAVFQEMKLSAV